MNKYDIDYKELVLFLGLERRGKSNLDFINKKRSDIKLF